MGPGNRPLDLDWIEDFLVLAEGGNFSRAAQARAIAQPAFSRHIRALEEWVGAELVDRSAHPATLTPAGRVFQPAALELLDGLTAARSKARAASRQDARSLQFAATHLLSLEFFPRWLASLEPHLEPGPIRMASDSSRACEDLLLQRRVDFVLCHGHASAPGRLDEASLPMRVLGTDWLLPLAAPDARGRPRHAFGEPEESAAPPPLAKASAEGGPAHAPDVLAYSESSALGRIVATHLRTAPGEAAWAAHEAGQAPLFTAHHAVLLKTLATEGRGVAWLPESLASEALRAGTLVAAAPAALSVLVEVRIYRQAGPMGDAAEALWALLSQPDAAGLPPLASAPGRARSPHQ